MHGALFHLFGSVACHYSSARLQHSWHVHAGFRCRIIIAIASVPIQIYIWRTVTSIYIYRLCSLMKVATYTSTCQMLTTDLSGPGP